MNGIYISDLNVHRIIAYSMQKKFWNIWNTLILF